MTLPTVWSRQMIGFNANTSSYELQTNPLASRSPPAFVPSDRIITLARHQNCRAHTNECPVFNPWLKKSNKGQNGHRNLLVDSFHAAQPVVWSREETMPRSCLWVCSALSSWTSPNHATKTPVLYGARSLSVRYLGGGENGRSVPFADAR